MDFDVNTWRSLVTVVSLGLFVALVVWTLNKQRRAAFDEAAMLPFVDDAPARSHDTPSDAQRSNTQ
ncbi:MAG: cbb3-type cytochrome c oxidase subunit 3 [Burkholderiales bacterium]|jgi:cytochrome c oxidase cbb3-type subunit IV|nr:cbb3-type cytochrome c oxidase subunit 3 [Burkholderiales bacterium]